MPIRVFAIPAVLGTVVAACRGLTMTPAPAAGLAGTWTFGVDGSYERTGTLTTRFETTFPLECASSSADCADIGANLQSQPPVRSASCAWQFQQCSRGIVVTSDLGERGTFSISGTMLSMTPTAGQTYTKDYCVQGSHLHLLESVAFALPGNHIVDDIVGVRP